MAAARGGPAELPAFGSVGEMLKFLRRRARLTQRDLGLRVGYTEGHISRLEHDQRPPDVATVAALFVPALGLQSEPQTAARLLALASAARRRGEAAGPSPAAARSPAVDPLLLAQQPIPPAPPDAVARPAALDAVRRRLATERRLALCGLPGVGKTTLAAQIAREWADHGDVCWITLTDGVNATADALVRALARFLAARGHPEGAAVLATGEAAAPLSLDEQLGLVAAGLGRAAALVCLDNAHLLRADPRARPALAHLFAVSSATALLTSREEPGLAGVAVQRLRGLEASEAAAFVAASGLGLAADVRDRLVRRTAGSPMLLRLALGQVRGGTAEAADLVGRLETHPEVTEYLLTTTLAGMSPDGARLLALLATLRTSVDLRDPVLAELARQADTSWDMTAALRELQARSLLDHPAAAQVHPLIRDHVRAGLATDPERRRALHHLAAGWSRARDQVLEEIHHLAESGRRDDAAAVLVREVDTLVARGQAAAAADLAGGLLTHARAAGPPTRSPALVHDLLLARGDLLVDTLRAGEAEEAYQQAYADADDAARPRIARRLAESLLQRGRLAEAAELCDKTIAQVDPSDALLLAELAASSAQAHHNLSHFSQAQDRVEQALSLADSAVEASPQAVAAVRARAHHVLGQVLRVRGRRAEATRELHTAVEVAERAGRPGLAQRARYTLAVVTLEQGDLDGAAALFTSVAQALEVLGDSYGQARALQAISQTHLNRGAPALALETIEHARSIRARLGDLEGVAAADCVAAEVLLALGQVDEARRRIEQVVDAPTTIGAWQRAYHLSTLGVVLLVAGEPGRARVALTEGVALDEIAGTAIHLHLEICEAFGALLEGDLRAAERLLARRPDDPSGAVPPGIQLDLYALYVALASARDDTAEAMRWVAAMTLRARETGRRRYLDVAERLSRAVAQRTPPEDLPRLVWSR